MWRKEKSTGGTISFICTFGLGLSLYGTTLEEKNKNDD